MLTRELQKTLSQASIDAHERHHEYITLEHVLLAMTADTDAHEVLTGCGVDTKELASQLDHFLSEEVEPVPEGYEVPEPEITSAFQRVLENAAMHALNSQKGTVDSSAVLAAMFYENSSHGVYLLEEMGLSRLDVLNYISHGVNKEGVRIANRRTHGINEDAGEEKEDLQAGKKGGPLARYCVDMLELAKNNKIDPLIGREDEIARTIQILCRRRKNNPLYVGEPGVGKTAIAEGLALKISRGEVPKALKASQVFLLDLAAVEAGASYKGEMEERLRSLVEELSKIDGVIIFIDEIHTMVRAAARESGASDVSGVLKPALTSGAFRCIGATTHEDYKKSFEKDKALARRFQKIDVIEPSVEDTKKILHGLKSYYEAHHEVSYPDDAIDSIGELSSRHINDRFLPDKAVDVMDEAGALVKLRLEKEGGEPVVTVHDVELTVASMARIPAKTVTGSDKARLQSLEKELKSVIFGQDHAIEQMVKAIKLSRSGLNSPDKPIASFLCSGPTGVGKTELAKQLAKVMGVSFHRYDMSEYMEKHTVSRLIGAPPGYVGFEQGGLLTDAVNKTPHCVVVMDEIEKAHPDLFNILLQVMDHGTLTDNNGKKADFRNVVLILTTNAGAREMMGDNIGFRPESGKTSLAQHLEEEKAKAERERQDAGKNENYGFGMGKGRGAIEKTFSPEFRNRLDAWIAFNPLSYANILLIVDKFAGEVVARLKEKDVEMTISPAARDWLAEKGYDRQYGARPMARLIKEKLSEPLAEELLFGKLQNGGKVVVDVDKDKDVLAIKVK